MRARLGSAAALVAAATTAVLLGSMTPALAATTTVIATNQTFPSGGEVLTGADGLQHYWTADHISGVCRFDGSGTTWTEDTSSCILAFGGSPQIKPGNLAFDGQFLYIPDVSAKSIGVGRALYDPTLNAGRGGFSVFNRAVINCGLAGSLPWATTIGPDGNLYVSFKKNANITRVTSPGTFAGNCAAVSNIGLSGDGRKSFALAFAGTNLWETNNNGVGVIPNATTIPNGTVVQSSNVFPIAGALGLASDANGEVYLGTSVDLRTFDGVVGTTPVTIASGLAFVNAVAVDPTSVGVAGTVAGRLFLGDDPSNGLTPGAGRLWVALS